jgi:hypothetical protein
MSGVPISVTDDRIAAETQLWKAHCDAPFPRRLLYDDVAGVEMVMLHEEVSGCIHTWLSNAAVSMTGVGMYSPAVSAISSKSCRRCRDREPPFTRECSTWRSWSWNRRMTDHHAETAYSHAADGVR